MQYNILINQGKAIEWGLNLQQAAVFSFIFNIPTWAQHVDIDGVRHYHIRKSKIASEIPVITNKPDTVYRIMRTLAEKGIISMTTDGRRTLVAITELGASWNTDANLSDDDISQYHQGKRSQARTPKSDPRLAVMQRDGYQCQACGKEMNPDLLGKTGNDCPEIDHIIPRSRGGSDNLDNLQCLCGFCNRSKGTMTMEEYAEKNPTLEKYPRIGGKISGRASEKSPTDQDTSNQDTSNQSIDASAAADAPHGSRAERKRVQQKTTAKPDVLFEQVWSRYPKRAGSNPKNKAQSAWNARKKLGVSPAVMANGLDRYIAFCEATGRVGTEFVMQAARFFGPSHEFENDWTPAVEQPKPQGKQLQVSGGPNLPDFNFED